MVAAAALVVDVLGRVGEQGQEAEGADQVELVVDRAVGERRPQLVERAAAVTPGVDGPPADLLDELEHLVAGLVADDLAEDAAEQPDVGAEGGVLAGLGARLDRCGVDRPGHHRDGRYARPRRRARRTR